MLRSPRGPSAAISSAARRPLLATAIGSLAIILAGTHGADRGLRATAAAPEAERAETKPDQKKESEAILRMCCGAPARTT